MGALRGIAARGLRVPVDIAVVGFDGSKWGDIRYPPLTTMAQPVREIAKLATELVLARVNGACKEPQMHRVETNLLIRGSCGIEPLVESGPRAQQSKKR